MDDQSDQTNQPNQIDWSDDQGLSKSWWFDQGSLCGASTQQIIFSACVHRGMTATASAKRAGYAGNTDTIRQAGFRARHSAAVETLLGMANALTGTGVEPVVNPDESKSILSKLARRSDPTTRIRALEALGKIRKDEAEMELRRQEVAPLTDIRAELREIAKISPELAKAYAESKGLAFDMPEIQKPEVANDAAE